MATTRGIISTTGIAGLALRRGLRYLARGWRLSCDNLISAVVLRAEGSLLTCDADRKQELFWAICVDGGNVGVVASFEYRRHQVADIYPSTIDNAAQNLYLEASSTPNPSGRLSRPSPKVSLFLRYLLKPIVDRLPSLLSYSDLSDIVGRYDIDNSDHYAVL